jgi:hypothetical protein
MASKMRVYTTFSLGIIAFSTLGATCNEQMQQARVASSTIEHAAYLHTLMSPLPVASGTPTASNQMPWSSTLSKQTSAQTRHTSSASVPMNFAGDYMVTVNHWRVQMGLATLSFDLKLESNAMNTVVAGNGGMVHKLHPGTFAQVLAPGPAEDFEKIFVGGWLCEKPSLPGLNGVCTILSQGWSYNGQTGHAEILTSGSYTRIGCAFFKGIWCCDLA